MVPARVDAADDVAENVVSSVADASVPEEDAAAISSTSSWTPKKVTSMDF